MSGLDRIAARRGEQAVPAAEPESRRIEPPTPYTPPPVDVLPRPIKRFVEEVSAAVGCDRAMVTIPALCVCAGAIGAARSISPKRRWVEPCVLWGVVVAESGTKKSPAFDFATAPLVRLQEERYQDWKDALSRWQDAGKNGNPPTLQQAITSDTTIEALASVLRDNTHGVVMAQDELTSWFESMKTTRDRSGNAGKWLELHSGKTININRKTGEERHVWVPSPRVSIAGGIQPLVFRGSMGSRERSSGLLARLLLAWPPRKLDLWTEAEPEEHALGHYERLLHGLLSLKGETTDRDTERPYVLKLRHEARIEYQRWYDSQAETQFAAVGAIASHMQKLRGACIRIAAVFHCCDYADLESSDRVDVSVEAVQRAVTLTDWFISETIRIYRFLDGTDIEVEQMDLYQYLLDNLGGQCSPAELHKRNKSRWPSTDIAEMDLDGLAHAGLAEWSKQDTGGRPKRVLTLIQSTPAESAPDAPDTPDTTIDGIEWEEGFIDLTPDPEPPDIWPGG